MTDGRMAWIIILAILIIDQVIKIEVKTSMTLGESIRITDWFYITFVENNGMAWGMTFINKLFLSVLRIVAVSAIGWFICQTVKQKGRTRYVVFFRWFWLERLVTSLIPYFMALFSVPRRLFMWLIGCRSVLDMPMF